MMSFLTMAFFSFAIMTHEQNGGVPDKCPFSATGAPLCPENMLAVALHHVSLYNSIFNILVNWGVTSGIILFLAYATAVLLTSSIRLWPLALCRSLYADPPITSGESKMMRRLSLFENSPSY